MYSLDNNFQHRRDYNAAEKEEEEEEEKDEKQTKENNTFAML
jgi:hypothetical protein